VVVVVEATFDVVVVVAEVGVVVVAVRGAVVVVLPAVEMDWSIVVIVVALGLGRLLPDGRKATVINWPSANFTLDGSVVVVGWFTPGGWALGHTLIWTWPDLPASGVCFGHLSPFLSAFSPGIVIDVDVSPNLG
jgi:hypothetical protein